MKICIVQSVAFLPLIAYRRPYIIIMLALEYQREYFKGLRGLSDENKRLN